MFTSVNRDPVVLIVPGVGTFLFQGNEPDAETLALMKAHGISVTLRIENSKPADGERR